MSNNAVSSIAVEAPKKERLYFWDNFKGLLIFLVVLCHMIIGYGTSKKLTGVNVTYLLLTLEAFVMPAFAFCSGFLSKSAKARSLESVAKLLAMFLIFNLLLGLDRYLTAGVKFQLLRPCLVFWFLVSMMVWRLTVDYVSKIKWCLFFSIALTLCAGFCGEINNTMVLARTIGFYPFFLAGYMFDKDKLMKVLNWKYRVPVGIVAFIALFGGCYYLSHFHFMKQAEWLYDPYPEFGTGFVNRCILIAVAFLFIGIFLLAIPNCKIPLLSKWGRNSLGIYVCHRRFALMFLQAFPVKEFSNTYYIYIFIITFLLCLVFGADIVTKYVNLIVNKFADLILGTNKKAKHLGSIVLPLMLLLAFALNIISSIK
ncbi:MAG: acyltransferase family protein [Clostridiales bacterium]|nr:acyltransferase family protein [Candidatus Cacconaster stercorequi]